MPAKGFATPSILSLSTWAPDQLRYLRPALEALRAAGYTRHVEPCAGAFTGSVVAAAAGYAGTALEGSDIGLLSAVLGTLFGDQDPAALDIRVDGEPLALRSEDPLRNAATVLHTQLLLRMATKPRVRYWVELERDLIDREDEHIAAFMEQLRQLDERLRGLRYRSVDLWQHLAELRDDEHAVVVINPPTYKLAYEKFFDTDGRLTWAQPAYTVYDAKVDTHRLMREVADARCLVLCNTQWPSYQAPGGYVYVAQRARDWLDYICCNRPEEVKQVYGHRVGRTRTGDQVKLAAPVIPEDHEVGPESRIAVEAVTPRQAGYYRDLWQHKLDGATGGQSFAVYVDGYLAGVGAYDTGQMATRMYADMADQPDPVLLIYSCAPLHCQRLPRLISRIALARESLLAVLPGYYGVNCSHIRTAELTRYPEAKDQRGLMKLYGRRPDAVYGNRLLYVATPTEDGWAGALRRWLADEARYAKVKAS